MEIVGINHVQITVPRAEEDAAHHFYCDLLHLPEIPKPESLQGRGGFWLQVGALQVHVGVEDGVDRNATKAHVAYEVTDLPAWEHYLIYDCGIKILEAVPIPGYDRFEFRDPFGNRVELIENIS